MCGRGPRTLAQSSGPGAQAVEPLSPHPASSHILSFRICLCLFLNVPADQAQKPSEGREVACWRSHGATWTPLMGCQVSWMLDWPLFGSRNGQVMLLKCLTRATGSGEWRRYSEGSLLALPVERTGGAHRLGRGKFLAVHLPSWVSMGCDTLRALSAGGRAHFTRPPPMIDEGGTEGTVEGLCSLNAIHMTL